MSEVTKPEALDSLEGAVIGRFVVRERLGEGGMGEVYRAEDTRLGRSVALKRLAPQLRSDPQYRQKFLKEAERASRFSDPHIAALYDILEHGDELFLVMELVAGSNLDLRLRQPISLRDFLQLALECAQALAAAHAHDIVHCDIKPDNIMITPSGSAKVLDFGVARQLSHTGASATLTSAGFTGTLGYTAPEVIREHSPGATADIFSLGVVLYEALAGFHPFLRAGFFDTCDRILHVDPLPLDRVGETPAALSAIIARMIAKDPAQRYQRATDVIADLKAVVPGAAMLPTGNAIRPSAPGALTELHPASPSSRLTSATGWITRRRRLVVAVAAAIVLILLATSGGPRMVSRWARRVLGIKPRQLAVLPFTLSGTGEQGELAFAAGLAEAISSRLGGPDDPIQVVPAAELRNQKVDSIDKARQLLAADLVLTGSLRQDGNLVRVAYSVVDAASRRQLRGDTVTVPAGDPLALEDQLMASVLRSLGVEARPGAAAHGTSDGSAYTYYLRARGYLQDYTKLENLDAAVAAFKNALERDPNYAAAYAGMGQAFWRKFQETRDTTQVSNATLACERALAIDPNLSQAHICLGTAFTNTGKYDDAVQQFHQALARDPTDDEAVRGLAFAFEKRGSFPEAENTFRQAIKLRPYYWANYNQLGTFYWRRGRYDEAARLFQQVIAIAPDNYRGYNNLAGVFLMQGKYADAVPLLQRCVAIRPNPSGFANLGNAHFFQRNFDQAVTAFAEAVRLNQKDYELRGNLADAQYWATGQRDAAMVSYHQAIELSQPLLQVNPKDANLLLALAEYYAMLGEQQHALDFLARAQAADPKARDLPRNAAIIYAQFGDRQQALDSLEKFFAAGGSPAYVRSWPNFDSLDSDPRYRQLIKSAESLQVH